VEKTIKGWALTGSDRGLDLPTRWPWFDRPIFVEGEICDNATSIVDIFLTLHIMQSLRISC